MAVKTVVFLLMSIKAVDEHKMFLKKEHKTLRKCEDHWELFGDLNLYWNYLAFDLLEQLIEVLTLKQAEFDPIATEMASYKGELENFRRSTALELFCLAECSKLGANIPESFKEVVVKFKWPGEVNLEMVEEFRQRYAQAYNLDKCAMLIYSIRAGSFTVTWLLPDSVLDRLTKTTAPVQLFRHFRVIRLDIDRKCFYKMPVGYTLIRIISKTIVTVAIGGPLPYSYLQWQLRKQRPACKKVYICFVYHCYNENVLFCNAQPTVEKERMKWTNTDLLSSHLGTFSVQSQWVYCSSPTSRHAVVNISRRKLLQRYGGRSCRVRCARRLTGTQCWTSGFGAK